MMLYILYFLFIIGILILDMINRNKIYHNFFIKLVNIIILYKTTINYGYVTGTFKQFTILQKSLFSLISLILHTYILSKYSSISIIILFVLSSLPNILERVFKGYVTDYLSIKIKIMNKIFISNNMNYSDIILTIYILNNYIYIIKLLFSYLTLLI